MGDEKLDGAASRQTRIFVGGLGPTVMPSDLEKTFSTLGRVNRVEIVRTNARSFGYMDFEPFSDKALVKLFSMYNGCMWKGGRLRLEKAKEHYLVRLKKEWAEDAELLRDVPEELNSDKDVSVPGKLKKAVMEEMQLDIFFPRLRKVKSLPYSGTGKHKYSFQRIEIPSLPVHFCDCEEHSGHSATAVEKLVSSINGGINEKELIVMNSVMNKLFGREKAAESEIAGKATEGERISALKNRSDHATDEAPCNDEEISESTDEDNLVLNIATEGDSGRLNMMQLHGKRSTLVDKEYEHNRSEPSNDRTGSGRLKHQDTDNISNPRPNKKARGHTIVQSIENEFGVLETKKKVNTNVEDEFASTKGDHNDVLGNSSTGAIDIQSKSNISEPIQSLSYSQKSSWKELVGESTKSLFTLSDVNILKPITLNEAQSGIQAKSEMEQTTKGCTWAQKSSWKELVGQTSNTLFSISDILPSVKQKASTKCSEKIKPNMKKHQREEYDEESSKHLEVGKAEIMGKKVFASLESKAERLGKGQETLPDVGVKPIISSEENLQNVGNIDLPKESNANGVEEPKKGKGTVGIEVCPFMRSAASEREWVKAKEALSRSLKKKSGEDSVSKSSKRSSNCNF
ncbi:protein REPRESSOR OF SILENCING 3 [Aristolochia californica]|uniref:protein REPRESSOR OF SILENCING 3 n=1 Tax=Aristolochia californica TaxID=171875 RepID=UPI0035DE17FC